MNGWARLAGNVGRDPREPALALTAARPGFPRHDGVGGVFPEEPRPASAHAWLIA
jgi:hypothetical protein